MCHLREGSAPYTVHRDWPYLTGYEVVPAMLTETYVQKNWKKWVSSRIAVDFCEAVFNAHVEDFLLTMDLLAHLTHPATDDLLWTILKGTFGLDALRSKAMDILYIRAAIKPGETGMVFLEGASRVMPVSPVPDTSQGLLFKPLDVV